MCRLLAYSADRPSTLAGVVGDGQLDAFRQLACVHKHGWGMAWFPEQRGVPGRVRSIESAVEDPLFEQVAEGQVSEGMIIHLRQATPGVPVVEENVHPFVHDGVAFAHNGSVFPIDRMNEMVSASDLARVTSTTDSERYGLAVLAEMRNGCSLLQAFAKVQAHLFESFEPTSLNALVVTADELVAVCRYAWDAKTGTDKSADETYGLWYTERPGATIVASSESGQSEKSGWQRLANGAAISFKRGHGRGTVSTL